MEKEVDIVALGELLIDFTEAGTNSNGNRIFEQNPGGAPANLLTAASHMGMKTAVIGKVGKDMHGQFLKEVLNKEGICIDYVKEDENSFTTLAFVAINENGERQFSFARKPGADTQLTEEDLDQNILKSCKIFHFGSLSLTDEPSHSATIEAVQLAKEAGADISYDPNYRETLWQNKKTAVDQIKSVIKYVDMMKVSDEESFLITGEKDYKKAAKKLLEMGPKLIAVTLGSEGVFLATAKFQEKVDSFQVKAIDTTGAGDSFWGGFLSHYLLFQKKIEDLEEEKVIQCAVYGNATACLCVQKRGGIPSIPDKEEVIKVIKQSYVYQENGKALGRGEFWPVSKRM